MRDDYLDSTWLNIGGRRQLFIDDLLLAQVQDVTRKHYRPQRASAQPLIKTDQPWEHKAEFSCNTWNVIRDPQDGLFKCWYEDFCLGNPKDAPTWINEADGKLCVNFHGTFSSRVCYAQSEDGIHWEKPPVGIRENGHKTNIVLGGPEQGYVHCAYVMLDSMEADASKRYKAAFEYRRIERGDDMTGEGAFRIATSPDGIRWTISERGVRFGSAGPVLGDVIHLARDPESGIYWANNRHPRMCSSSVLDRRTPLQRSWISPTPLHARAQENRRRIFRSQSIDLHEWSTPQPLVVPDSEWDNIDDSFYGMEQFQAGDDWIGLLNVFHQTDNDLDVQLTYSRDGRRFARVQPGRAWLGVEDPEAWDGTIITTCSKPVIVNDELYVYYGGCRNHHDWWIVGASEGLPVAEATDMSLVKHGMGLMKMKLDRFCSISSSIAREGLIITPPFVTAGKRLVINARTRAGGAVSIAMADGQGRVYPGFGREDCVSFSGDAVIHPVVWRNENAWPTDRFRRLYFYLKDADLFSFQFVD